MLKKLPYEQVYTETSLIIDLRCIVSVTHTCGRHFNGGHEQYMRIAVFNFGHLFS